MSGIARLYVVAFLIFWGTSILFFIVVALIYIPTHMHKGFPFLHISPTLIIFYLFKFAIWTDVSWYLTRFYSTIKKWKFAICDKVNGGPGGYDA